LNHTKPPRAGKQTRRFPAVFHRLGPSPSFFSYTCSFEPGTTGCFFDPIFHWTIQQETAMNGLVFEN
jgi:hypothetical protein